jgi:hypothetical protein
VKNLDTVLREKEQQVEVLQTQIEALRPELEALRLVSQLLKEDGAVEAAMPKAMSSGLASVPAPTHVMQSSSVGGGFEREGGYSTSGLKQFP